MQKTNHEKRLLAGACHHVEKRINWISQLTIEHFQTSEYSFMFEVIEKHQNKSLSDILTAIHDDGIRKGYNAAPFIDFVEMEGFMCDSDFSLENIKLKKRYNDISNEFIKIDPEEPTNEQMNNMLSCVEDSKDVNISKNNLHKGAQMVATEMLQADRAQSLKTGFESFDKLSGGLRNGVYLVTGRPGLGKTTFSLQTAIETAVNNPNEEVLFFTLEMSLRDCNYKTTSYLTEIPVSRFEKTIENNQRKLKNKEKGINEDFNIEYGLNAKEQYALMQQFNKIPKNMTTIDISGINCNQIENIKNSHEKETGRKVCLIIVDYVQIMSSNNPRITDETARVQAISHEVRRLSKQLPLLILAQLNRDADPTQCPKLGDLKSSGQLEQDAAMVLTIYQPDANIDLLKVGVIKNRFGKNHVFFDYFFNKKISKFILHDPTKEIELNQP